VELDELEVLVGKTSTGNHSHTVTSTCVCRRAAEIGSAVSTGSQDGVLGKESVECTIFLVVSKDTAAFTILHDEIESEELNEIICAVSKRLTIECVQKNVTGSIGSRAGSVCLTTLSVLLGLTTESSLITV
jgi:hypothetical protein